MPQYLLLRSLGVLDTLWAMILPGIFSPLGTVLLWRGFSAVPQETIEAAQGEGANLFVLLTKIALPMCKRELSVLLLVSIAEEWNLLEQPMAYIKSSQNYPLSVYLSTAAIADTAQLLASCVLALIPIIVAFCLLSGAAISGERKGE